MAGKTSIFVNNSAPSVDATWLNIIQTENSNIITTSGQTESDSILNQEAIAIASYAAQGAVFCTDSGTANSYVLTQVSPFEAPYALTNGLTLVYRAGNPNTGASTVVAFGFTSKNIKMPDGTTDVPPSYIPANRDTKIRYNSSLGVFILDITNGQLSSIANSNILINGSFAIDQINVGASTATSDDAYCFDGMYALTQTASILASQQSLQEDGQATNGRFTQNQASAQRFGIAQICEGHDSQPYRGSPVTLSARIRSSSSQAIRYAILEWTGTVNSVTSDVVNDWTSSSYTAGGFFLGSNLTVTAVGSTTPSAATWTNITLTGTLGSSTNNLIVFIWTEGTAAQNVTLDIGNFKLEKGSVVSSFIPRSAAEELILCQRYVEKSYASDVAPGTSASTTTIRITSLANTTTNIGNEGSGTVFKVSKIYAPTVTIYSQDGTINNLNYQRVGTATAKVAGAVGNQSVSGFSVTSTAASSLVAGDAVEVSFHFLAKSQL